MRGMTFDELLSLWNRTRAPEVAEAIERLTPRSEKLLYPKSATNELKQLRWLAAAEDPAANFAVLLETLHDAFSEDVQERLQIVATWPDDSRICSALTRMWEQPAHLNVSTLPFWTALALELIRRADRRSLDRLNAVAALGPGWVGMFRPHMRPVIPKVLDETRAALTQQLAKRRDPALTEQERLALKHLAEAPVGPEAALAAIYANPTELNLRLVYADLLTSVGDPHGEFITLQCLEAPTPAQLRRQRALLREHLKALAVRGSRVEPWAGVLGRVCLVHEWERGFPARVELNVNSRSKLSSVLGHPAWSTVHTLHLGSKTVGAPLEVVVHPAMNRLLALEGLYASEVRSLARQPRQFSFRSLTIHGPDAARALPVLATSDAFPQLVEVQLKTRASSDGWTLVRNLTTARPGLRVRFA